MRAAPAVLGILGGTFDPIHFGHLRIGLELAEATSIERVHLIPTYQPAHRNAPKASAEARFAMLASSVADNPLFVADRREIDRQDASYTIDTLNDLRKEFPKTTFCVFLGLDSFLGFADWKNYSEILTLAHLVVAKRPHFEIPEKGIVYDLLKSHKQENVNYIQQHKAGGIFIISTSELHISASEIRKQIAMGRNPRYLLPDKAYHYLQLNGTYHK